MLELARNEDGSSRRQYSGRTATGESRTRSLHPGRVWLVIPAHNEAERLGETLRHYLSTLTDDDQIVVVVNGCGDATQDVARAQAECDDRLHVLIESRRIGRRRDPHRAPSRSTPCR